MSQYYTSQRVKGLYDPSAKANFKLSRSKLDLFLNCARCFYLDRRLGISRPPGFPFNLNTAVDTLLKKEFDVHRAKNTVHPLMKAYKLDLIPFKHEKMDEWRENFKGVQYLHKPTNFIITGAVDDLWADPSASLRAGQKGVVYIVDYKATSKTAEVNLDADWQIGYKCQMEIYQWLGRHNEDLKKYQISNTGYFVYCNGKTDRKAFDGKLEFDIKIIPYEGDDSWVEEAVIKAHECLKSDRLPEPSKDCDYCNYVKARKHA